MNQHYQLSRIHNYVAGLMSQDEMYALEREALEDPFLQDALDGYKLQEGVNINHLSLLQQRLSKRVAQKAADRNQQFFTWQRLSIGSLAAVLFVVACTYMLLRNSYLGTDHKGQEVHLTHPFEHSIEVNPVYDAVDNNAFPTQGWKHFNEFIVSSNQVTEQGMVHIQFQIQDGRPTEFKVLQSDSRNLSAEVERLLLIGPDWSGNQAEITVEYHK